MGLAASLILPSAAGPVARAVLEDPQPHAREVGIDPIAQSRVERPVRQIHVVLRGAADGVGPSV